MEADDICVLSDKLKSQLMLRDGEPADKMARRCTLEAILQLVESDQSPPPCAGADTPTVEGRGDGGCDGRLERHAQPVLADVLQCLSDPSERCRELAAQLTTAWLARLSHRLPVYPLLVPVLRQRLAPVGDTAPAETSEEVRLCLVRLCLQLVTSDGPHLAAYLDDLVATLARSLADKSPDVKTAACAATSALAHALPRHFHLQSASLVSPLATAVSHQRWRVREPCIRAIGDVVRYGDNALLRDVISHLAQRMFDQVPQVRLAVTEVAGRWLIELPDRYSFFAKILPLVLTSLRDPVTTVRERAEELWQQAGQLYLTENEEENRQLINYPPPPPAGYPAGVCRPSLGCRLLSQRCFCTLVPGATADLQDWVVGTRVKVCQLLYTLTLHQETSVTQYLAKLVAALTAALADDEPEVVTWAVRVAQLLGCFSPVTALTEVVLKPITGDSSATGRQLLVLAACLRGCPGRRQMAPAVADVIAADGVCQSHEPVRQDGLLGVVAALLQAESEPVQEAPDAPQEPPEPPQEPTESPETLPEPAVAAIFRTLVTVAGHAHSNDVTHRAQDLVCRLAEASGHSVSTLLSSLGLPLLDWLSKDVELWGPASSDLLTMMALLKLTDCPPEALLRRAVPLLGSCCRPGRAAPLRLACFSQLCRLMTAGDQTSVRHLLTGVTDDIVLPSIVWHPGRSDAAIRTAAISCLYMELQVPDVTVDMVTGDLQQLVASITGLFEEDDRKSRLLAIRCLAALFRLAPPGGIDVQQLHVTATELLRRLDDTVAEVRHCAAETFPTLLHALPADYCGRQWRGHLEYFAKALLVFLDDTDVRLQTLVYEALLSTGRLNADVVCELATEQRAKHRSPQLCDQLVQQLTGDAATIR